MTFQDQQLNSMTFQVFHDLYEPWNYRESAELEDYLMNDLSKSCSLY